MLWVWVLHWRCFIGEYNPILHYIQGTKNNIADTFSQLHHRDNDVAQNKVGKNTVCCGVPLGTKLYSKIEDYFHSLINDPELVECLLTLPNKKCYLDMSDLIAV